MQYATPPHMMMPTHSPSRLGPQPRMEWTERMEQGGRVWRPGASQAPATGGCLWPACEGTHLIQGAMGSGVGSGLQHAMGATGCHGVPWGVMGCDRMLQQNPISWYPMVTHSTKGSPWQPYPWPCTEPIFAHSPRAHQLGQGSLRSELALTSHTTPLIAQEHGGARGRATCMEVLEIPQTVWLYPIPQTVWLYPIPQTVWLYPTP